MKLTPRTTTFCAALALAAVSGTAFAQGAGRSDRPYYRNHQGESAQRYGSTAAPGSGYGLREDLDGTAVSDRDAAQACDVLTDMRKRESCTARVAGEVLRNDTTHLAPVETDSSANGRTRRGSDYGSPSRSR